MHNYFCPACGCALDPGERCDCRENNAEQPTHKLVTYADWEAAGSFEEAASPGDYVEERIVELEKRSSSAAPAGWEFDGGKVVMNTDENRIQVFFDEKLDNDTRTELRGAAFKWAPSQGAWQRQLTDNAIRAAKYLKCLKPTD